MYNWSFLFVVLHKPTLLPSTFKELRISKFHIPHNSINKNKFYAIIRNSELHLDLVVGGGGGGVHGIQESTKFNPFDTESNRSV